MKQKASMHVSSRLVTSIISHETYSWGLQEHSIIGSDSCEQCILRLCDVTAVVTMLLASIRIQHIHIRLCYKYLHAALRCSSPCLWISPPMSVSTARRRSGPSRAALVNTSAEKENTACETKYRSTVFVKVLNRQ